MGKNKLKKFDEMAQLPNVFQCAMRDISDDNEVVKMAGRWRTEFFHNDYPIIIELGCGHGDYTTGLARMYPDRNFIGIDIKGARMWHGAKIAFEEKIENAAFLRVNIEWLPRFFSQNEVDEVWITFPDPQMKKATKRLTSTFFMQRYCRIVKPDGLIHLKTDSPFLYTYTREMISINHLPLIADTDNLYSTDDNDILLEAKALQTHYEKQWIDRGMDIKYLCWRLRDTEWTEPVIEIEKDTYRSYGRYARTQNV